MLSIPSLLAQSQELPVSDNNSSKVIAFTSDTQAPMWVETLWLKSHKNRHATKMVFSDVLRTKPTSLFILGDVVNLGYSNRQWKPIDRYLKDLRDSSINTHAILGNHEVMGRVKKGQSKFQKRFPNHVSTGYVEVVDSIAIVLLNSNFNKMSKQDDEKQLNWYTKTLHELDADSSIQYIITACHHSPYTNSKIVKPSKEVQQKFVPPYLASAKSKLFLTGHCHGFEHYQVEGKDFMVIGGGGGLHQPLRKGEVEFRDIASEYKPLFHYLTVQRTELGLNVTSHQLNKDYKGFDQGLSVSIRNIPASDLAGTVRQSDQGK